MEPMLLEEVRVHQESEAEEEMLESWDSEDLQDQMDNLEDLELWVLEVILA